MDILAPARKLARSSYKDMTLKRLYPDRYRKAAESPLVKGKVVFLEVREEALTDNFRLIRAALEKRGWKTTGDEAMKLTLCPKTYGYTGTELAGLLRTEGIECEYADPDHTVLMPSAETGEGEWERVRTALEKKVAPDRVR